MFDNNAKINVILVYHVDNELPRLVAKDVADVNDPAWITINEDALAHRMLHIEPSEYNAMDYEALESYHKKYISLHKAWHNEYGHKFSCQNQARDAFREHVK